MRTRTVVRTFWSEFDVRPGANLRGAALQSADLQSADLRGADLQSANLQSADLRGADLQGAILEGANLCGANLRGADLRGADLQSANLQSAILEGANLWGANLRHALVDKTTKFSKFQLPQTKSLIVYKKVAAVAYPNAIAKLRIPARAKRTASLVGNKCRAERAIVLEIKRRGELLQKAFSLYDANFVYEVGMEVKPLLPYDGDIRLECTSGIHFFMTEQEALDY